MNIDNITSELMSTLKNNELGFALKPSNCGKFALRSFFYEDFELNIFYHMASGDQITLFEVVNYNTLIMSTLESREILMDVIEFMISEYTDIVNMK